MSVTVAAIDIGASGGRVMVGRVDASGVELEEVHRFQNTPRQRDGHLRWDISVLFDEVVAGLSKLARTHGTVDSIGVDTWAVDYALLDGRGQLLDDPICYRDDRTADAVARVHAQIDPSDLFRRNGLQFLPFTTLFQLVDDRASGRLAGAAHIVLLPDLLTYWLTGQIGCEATNASTTGLLGVSTRDWDAELCALAGVHPQMLGEVVAPGSYRATLLPQIAERTGLATGTPVVSVASHDTASAVVSLPARPDEPFAYISSGSWSLVGLEVADPVLTEGAQHHGFTNELGVDGRTRFLRNVGGLWLLEECRREWALQGDDTPLPELLAAAIGEPGGGPVFDVDDPSLITPGGLPDRIRAAAGAPLDSAAELARCVLDSLAHGSARAIHSAAALTGISPTVVHVVGGGSRNEPLCQLTADRVGLPVTAGPVEATALGNALIQARALDDALGDLDALRSIVRRSNPPREIEPSPLGASS